MSAIDGLQWLWRRWTSLSRRTRAALLAALVAIWLLPGIAEIRHVPGHWWQAVSGQRPLYHARSWHYQLDKVDVDQISKVDSELLVTDYAKEEGSLPLTREEVARLKVRPGGGRRLAISYLSIGEAEEYRYYWKDEWPNGRRPRWHVEENCAWPRAHMVRFWHDSWKDIMIRGPESYLARIVAAGFDGVYLDRIDVYENQTEPGRDLRAEMIRFVAELAENARRMKPGFIVIAQNAEDLLSERHYRDLIDGLGKEDLLHGHDGTGKRNKPKDIGWSLRLMRKLLWDWKPVFAVEYLETPSQIVQARAELGRLGLVATFQHRSLDGSDPTKPIARDTKVYGTPEWIETECKAKGKRWW